MDSVVVTLRRTGVVDVVAEAVLAEDSGERAHPRRVVRLVQIKNERYMGLDVDPVHNGRSCGRGGEGRVLVRT